MEKKCQALSLDLQNNIINGDVPLIKIERRNIIGVCFSHKNANRILICIVEYHLRTILKFTMKSRVALIVFRQVYDIRYEYVSKTPAVFVAEARTRNCALLLHIIFLHNFGRLRSFLVYR